MKKKCYKCRNKAVWLYMPGKDINSDLYCDNCVPRGCSCNIKYPDDDYDGDDKYDQLTDDKGRELPCCEFDYNKDGYDEEDFKDD